MSRTKSVFIGIGIVLSGLVIIGVMMATKPQPPKKPPQATSPLVEVIVPELEAVQFKVTAHGLVQPRTETNLISEVSGVVQTVADKFVAGGFFHKGDFLLQIDPTDYEVAVEQAKARLASEKAKLEQEKARAEQALKEWDMTGRSRDNAPALALRKPFLLEAEANVLSAEADLKKAEQKLARTIIRAPYDGMVKTKIADIGQYVSVGSQLGTTFAIEYAEVRLPLTDQELAFIDFPEWQSQENTDYPDVTLYANYAGKQVSWAAKLVRMEGVVDNQSRVHYAVARITDPYSLLDQGNQNVPLKVGTFVSAEIQGATEEQLVRIPREAFKDLDNILVSDGDNKLYQRQLEIVRSEANYTYVRSGLQPGDRILMTSVASPVQGMQLRIIGEEPLLEEGTMLAEKETGENTELNEKESAETAEEVKAKSQNGAKSSSEDQNDSVAQKLN